MKPVRGRLATVAATCVVLAVGACSSAGGARNERSLPAATDPLAGWSLFDSHNTPAAAEAQRLRRAGRAREAALLDLIAREPIATWLTRESTQPRRQVSRLTRSADRLGEVPVIVLYDVPGQGCAAGARGRGARSERRYLRWVSEVSAGIGGRRAIVILEPDAVPFAVTGCPIELQTLAAAVHILTARPGARVYVDAGNSSWIQSLHVLAEALIRAGVRSAAGFSLNVSNFQTDASSVAYGERLSALLGGAHFVVDTSRNGNGPDRNQADAPLWCNPPGRALGRVPTTSTAVVDLDAYLWIKPPGESDEACRPGEPAAGVWWRSYALELAENSLRLR